MSRCHLVAVLSLASGALAGPAHAARFGVSIGAAFGRFGGGFHYSSGHHYARPYGYSRSYCYRPSYAYSHSYCYPYRSYSYGGYGYGGFPFYSYSSPLASPFYTYPYSVLDGFSPAYRTATVELPPRVTYLRPSREEVDRGERSRPERDYYLERPDRERREPEVKRLEPVRPEQDAPPVSVPDLVRSQLRVWSAEPGIYLVRWTGPAADVSSVEFQAVDEQGEVLNARLLQEPPYRGLLRVPPETRSVVVHLEQKGGSSVSVKLPVAEFKGIEQ